MAGDPRSDQGPLRALLPPIMVIAMKSLLAILSQAWQPSLDISKQRTMQSVYG
jgi:hypothetical protein